MRIVNIYNKIFILLVNMSLVDLKSNLSTYRFPYNTKPILKHTTENNAKITKKKDSPTGVNGFIENITKTHITGYKGSKYDNTTKLYNSLNLPFKHTRKDGRQVNTLFPHTNKEGRNVNKIFKHSEKHSNNFVPQNIQIPNKEGRNVNTIFLHTPKEARVVNTLFPHSIKNGRNVNTIFLHSSKNGRNVNTIFLHSSKNGRNVNTLFLHSIKNGRNVNTLFLHSIKNGRNVNTIFPHSNKVGRNVNTIFNHSDKDGRDVNTIFDHTNKDGRDVNTIFDHTNKDGRDVNKPFDHTILTASNTSSNLIDMLNNQYATFNDRHSLQDTAYKPTQSLTSQPFCVRGIQRKGKEHKTNDLHYADGPFGLTNELNKLAGKAGKTLQTVVSQLSNIGGISTYITRAFEDAVRLAKWNISTQGIVFNIKNEALALMNPKIDGIHNLNRIKVGAMMIANATLAKIGVFSPDYDASILTQKLGMYSTAHSDDNYASINTSGVISKYNNRLLNLYDDMKSNTATDKATSTSSNIVSAVTGKPPTWNRLSGICGPDSFFGIGKTIISRYYDSTDTTYLYGNGEYDTKIKINSYSIINANSKYSDKYSKWSETKFSETNGIRDCSNTDYNLVKYSAILHNSPAYTTEDDYYNYNLQKSGHFETSSFDRYDNRTNRTDINVNEYKPSGSFFKIQNGRSTTQEISYTSRYEKGYKNANIGSVINVNTGSSASYTGKTLAGWFGYPSEVNNDHYFTTQIGIGSFIKTGETFGYISRDEQGNVIYDENGKPKAAATPWLLSHNEGFTGDKINAIDTGPFIETDWGFGEDNNVYNPSGSGYTKYRDLVSFYFMDGDLYNQVGDIYDRHAKSVLVFRAYITNFDDQFSPRWDGINIMGRPDPAYIYKGMTRNINFSFMVAASSRSEMIPMWRKLNYLASYTAPKYTATEKRMVGPFMRLTLGDLFRQTPIILTSLRYSIQENYPWDIALDKDLTNDAKQLPQVISVQCSANVISDYRPQFGGRFYSLSFGGGTDAKAGNSTEGREIYGAGDTIGNWLQDSTSEVHAATNANKNEKDNKKLEKHKADMRNAYAQI